LEGVAMMRKRFYSKREFAKKAGVSPQRLSELIRQGYIHTVEGGSVPETELEFFIREKLRKYIASFNKSYLCISIDKTAEELSALKKEYAEELAKRGSSLVEVSSISEMVSEIKEHVFGEDIQDSKLKVIDIKYKKAVLKELVKRTQNAVFRIMNKFVDTSTVGLIPAVSLYEMLMYNGLYTEKDDEKEEQYYKLLTTSISEAESTTLYPKGGNFIPLKMMEETYQSIIISLNLIDEQRQPLISRSDLSPELVREIDDMTNDMDIPDNLVLKEFFNKSLNINVNARRREEGSEALKILESIKDKALNAERGSKVSNICSKGFYTFCNLTDATSNEEIMRISADISDGYYKNITILSTLEDAAEKIPTYLVSAINTSGRNRTAFIQFNPNL